MLKNIFSLVPDRVRHEQFWISISKRNKWLVKMRFFAFTFLVFLTIGLEIIKFIFPAFTIVTLPLYLIALIILVYNLLFSKLAYKLESRLVEYPRYTDYLNHYNFHGLHFSLLQIIMDFLCLLVVIHFTGGIETPLYIFFIFHVIIGSLILPGPVIFLIVTLTYIITVTGGILELNEIIPHHSLQIFSFTLYNNTEYLIIFFVLFGIGLFLSTYFSNSIAKDLYVRENRLTKAYFDLENAEKSKTRYVMTIVHDLKTPIAAATTYLNMILEGSMGEVNPLQQQPLERSKLRLGNAIGTINDILYISQAKLESGINNIENVNLVEIIVDLIKDVIILIDSKLLQINTNFEENQEIHVQAEPKLLKLALANLISNSIKYTERGGQVNINLTENKDNVIISIVDNGIGIPEKDKVKVFGNFFRTSLSKEKGIEGSGLGLSLVLEVIKKYNGTIELISPSSLASEGKPGTEFIITMPKIFTQIT